MLSKLPIIRSSISSADLVGGLRRMPDKTAVKRFADMLAAAVHSKYCYSMNSGISSFYVTLKALKRISDRREVVIPAYTAGSLVVAIKKAGLKAVLCDISLDDFNLDSGLLSGVISSDTLAVIGVHLFGINIKDIWSLRARMPPGVFLIEDCAQSMGSSTGGRQAGRFGDAGFFSFNRGKNLPICGGGCVVTDNERIAHAVEAEIDGLEADGIFSGLSLFLKNIAFSVAGNPLVYGLGFGLISRFKETAPPKDFSVKKMGPLQAALGLRLMERMESLFSLRHRNGTSLIGGLRGIDGIILPEIPDKTRYVFNRLPVIFKDAGRREAAERMLWENGIESSRMYLRPLHHMFDLGYDKKDFPKAVYCAERLLTLPTHPFVHDGDIDKMINAIKETLT